jgi:predicted negative regulator of RcsB-dependent stress response
MLRLFDEITITTVDAIVALVAVFLLGWGVGFAYRHYMSKTKRQNHP